jgi:hypothetical protein
METTNYIVAFYGGLRRHYGIYSPIREFLVKHIEFLKTSPKGITHATFVFNESNHPEEEDILVSLENLNLPMTYSVVRRPNEGLSYGAWGDIIHETRNKFEYSFLIEDDYIPVQNDFLDYFKSKITEKSIFVSSLFRDDHAAIANGLFNNRLSNPDRIFSNVTGTGYQVGNTAQKRFLEEYQSQDFIFPDIVDIGYTEFRDDNKVINLYGDINKPLLIQPIIK